MGLTKPEMVRLVSSLRNRYPTGVNANPLTMAVAMISGGHDELVLNVHHSVSYPRIVKNI